MQAALAALALPPDHLALLGLICLIAGLVRGFSGFALSAMVMASGALILPPVQLIPVCWWLEMTASLFMLRGGWREANRKVALGLAIGSTIGVPFGLALTTQVDVETSKLIALAVIASLAALQLARVQLRFLASNWGLYGSGWMAGVATGLASVGGMVVALYVLA
ncbi:TSUP family transporter, partial [uncultured Planktomarina sp.]